MLPILTPRRAITLAQTVAALLVPHGGQAVARRNAWAGMVGDAQRSRDRREAEAALVVAGHRAALVTADTLSRGAVAGR